MKRTWWAQTVLALISALVLILLVLAMPASADDRQAGADPARSMQAAIGQEVACAMDGMKFARAADTPTAEVDGKTYYFCDESEKRQFLERRRATNQSRSIDSQ